MSRPFTFDRTIRIVFSLLCAGGIVLLLWVLRKAIIPFLVASLLAYMINPLVECVQHKLRVRNRTLSVFLALLILTSVLVLGCMELVPIVREQAMKFYEVATHFEKDKTSSSWAFDWGDSMHFSFSMEELFKFLSVEDIKDLVQNFTPKIWNFMGDTLNLIFEILTWLITLIYLVFILIDYNNIAKKWLGLFPQKIRPVVQMIGGDVLFEMNNYFRGQALVALCVGILFSIGFTLVGIPLGIVLGLFTGFLNLVPYLQIVGIIPLILLCLLKSMEGGIGFFPLFGLGLLVIGIVQVIQDTFLVPKIMGKVTGLNPVAILLSLSVWGTLFGVGGMIVALPLTTLLYSYYKRFILNNEPFIQSNNSYETKDIH